MTDYRAPAMSAGLDGSFTGSCVVCRQGTDTGLAFYGKSEWMIAGLHALGVPAKHAGIIVSNVTGCEPGKVPEGEFPMTVRVCGACVTKSGTAMSVAVLLPGGDVPTYGPKP